MRARVAWVARVDNAASKLSVFALISARVAWVAKSFAVSVARLPPVSFARVESATSRFAWLIGTVSVIVQVLPRLPETGTVSVIVQLLSLGSTGEPPEERD